MQRHNWSSANPKEHMSRLSLSPCTGYRLQLASSSRHWCLHIEQPQAQHPPTSTHYYESTSPPEAPPTSTHYYESTSPPEAPPTSTHYYESTSPPEAPPTSTHYYESTSPPEAPPTSTHYYESTSSRNPAYFHSLLRIYIPSRSLRSTSECRLVVPSLSRTFSFAILGWRKELPTPILNAESLTIFKRHLKIHLFRHHLISPLKHTKNTFTLFP